MAKQITGIFLFIVMTMVVALEAPALKFCLCDESFFLEDCACEVVDESQEGACASSCCGGEPIADSSYKHKGDCSLSLTMHLGEYFHGSNAEFSALDSSPELWLESYETAEIYAVEPQSTLLGVAAPPPPGLSEPLRLRFSVFLI